jgi:hypothetical protein
VQLGVTVKPLTIALNTFKILIGAAAAIAISVFGTLALSQCDSDAPSGGPGMIVTYGSTIVGVRIHIGGARLPNEADFPNAGSFGYAENPLDGGATEGAAPDGRSLPEWVEFSWRELPYPFPEHSSSQHLDDSNEQFMKRYNAFPVKKQRVIIRSRVPQNVIDEVVDSNRRKRPNELPDKALRIYFIWTEQGIKFHWRLWYRPEGRPDSYPREGGDAIQPG